MVRRNAKILAILSPVLTAAILLTAVACSQPPDPAAVEALTAGVWHGYVPEDETSTQPGGDFIYELRFEEGVFSGRAYLVKDGRHFSEIPVTGVMFDGSAIEIGMEPYSLYRGKADLEGRRIVGGIPGGERYEELNLTRVEARQWPMIRPRPTPAPEETTPVGTRPAERDDSWTTAAPSEVGIDPAAVEETVQAILAGEAGALHSFLVVRDGSLVVEEYFYGWGRNDLHQFASCTKSVTSLLVGIAIDQGLVSGVDARLLDFFPEYSEVVGRGWEGLRLEHWLTMTAGLDWTESERRIPPQGTDRFADILGRNVVVPPGERFRYVDRNMNLLPGVLAQATGVRADEFAAEHLFAPLGITEWDWEKRSWQGHPDMIGSLELRPRDLAKLGQLVLEEGSWQGRRVVSAEWIRESTRVHVAQAQFGMDYGYLWWRRDSPLGPMTLASGSGSHFIMVVPNARMVMVTTAGNQFNQQHDAVHRVIEQYLVPGVNLDR